MTTYKAVKVAGVRPTDVVLISGIGGLGHLALQYAKIFGGTTVAVDIADEKLQLAKDLGADVVLDARTDDVVAEVAKLGGADVAIGLAVSQQSFDTAYRSLRRGGRLVLVAMPADGVMQVPVFDLVVGGKSVVGSIVGTRQDLAEVFELHRLGRTRVVYETRRLDDVNACFDEVLSGGVTARLVFDLRPVGDWGCYPAAAAAPLTEAPPPSDPSLRRRARSSATATEAARRPSTQASRASNR